MKVTVSEKTVMLTERSEVNYGEYGVNRCEFVLPDSFSGLSVTAVFNNIPVPVIDGICYIPTLKAGNCQLGVYAYRKENESLELMYSPKPTMFYVGRGSYTEDTQNEDVPDISEYEEYCQSLAQYLESLMTDRLLVEYSSSPSQYQLYSAKAINGMFDVLQGELDYVSTLVGGAE